MIINELVLNRFVVVSQISLLVRLKFLRFLINWVIGVFIMSQIIIIIVVIYMIYIFKIIVFIFIKLVRFLFFLF